MSSSASALPSHGDVRRVRPPREGSGVPGWDGRLRTVPREEMAESYIDSVEKTSDPPVKDTFCLKSWLCKPTGLDWYRDERFACMGARSATSSTGRDRVARSGRRQLCRSVCGPCGWSTWVEGRTSSRSSNATDTTHGRLRRKPSSTRRSPAREAFDDDHAEDTPLSRQHRAAREYDVGYDREHIAKVEFAPRGPQTDHQDRVLRRHARLCDGTSDGACSARTSLTSVSLCWRRRTRTRSRWAGCRSRLSGDQPSCRDRLSRRTGSSSKRRMPSSSRRKTGCRWCCTDRRCARRGRWRSERKERQVERDLLSSFRPAISGDWLERCRCATVGSTWP